MPTTMQPRPIARALTRSSAARALEAIVTALIVYLALSIGIMQLKAAPSPIFHSAASAETLTT